MKKVLFIAVLIVSGVFTSCTDNNEEVLELLEVEARDVGGESDHDPDERPR